MQPERSKLASGTAGVPGASSERAPSRADGACEEPGEHPRSQRNHRFRGHPGVVPAVDPPLEIVLVEPEIPGNTGSIGRLAMATGCPLHLVGELGFRVDDRHLRRAGLDYWRQAEIYYHDSFASLTAELDPERVHLLSVRGARPHTAIPFRRGDFIVFGRESVGLPANMLEAWAERCFHIPMWNQARSHNLSNAVSIVLYEGLRQLRCF